MKKMFDKIIINSLLLDDPKIIKSNGLNIWKSSNCGLVSL